MMILQGHISFPLILDVLSFMTTRMGVKTREVDVQNLPFNLQYNRRNSLQNHYNLHSEIRTLKSSGFCGEAREQIKADGLIGEDGFVSSTNRQALLNDNVFPCSGSSESIHSDTLIQSIDKVGPIFFL